MGPTLGEIIRRKLDVGLLPIRDPIKIWVGYGRGEPCDACGTSILPGQQEHQLEYDDDRRYRLHLACRGLWEAYRRQRRWQERQR